MGSCEREISRRRPPRVERSSCVASAWPTARWPLMRSSTSPTRIPCCRARPAGSRNVTRGLAGVGGGRGLGARREEEAGRRDAGNVRGGRLVGRRGRQEAGGAGRHRNSPTKSVQCSAVQWRARCLSLSLSLVRSLSPPPPPALPPSRPPSIPRALPPSLGGTARRLTSRRRSAAPPTAALARPPYAA